MWTGNYIVIATGIILFFQVQLNAQPSPEEFPPYFIVIGFWNLENFYDTLNDPKKMDDDFTPTGTYAWNGVRYKQKLEHLSEVISKIGNEFGDASVAVMGFCEVENKAVLEELFRMPLLKNHTYKVILVEGPDARGIDPALVYDSAIFCPLSVQTFRVTLPHTHHQTREQLLVNGTLLGEKVHFLVCHWPSRRGDEIESEEYRISAAKVSKWILDSLLAMEPSARIIMMGDLNDEPNNKSIKTILHTVATPKSVMRGELVNAMEKSFKRGIGTLGHNDVWSLFDQMILSPAWFKSQSNSFCFQVARVFNKPWLCETYGRYAGYPLRTYAGGLYRGGYSDHFPVYVILKRE